ncbi:MAG TPA: hypothetical protein VF009_03280, partial [Solirubrobacterales bacterium]
MSVLRILTTTLSAARAAFGAAMIAAAVITVLSPAVKFVVEVGERALDGPTVRSERECAPSTPPADAR